jgi:hypothetical protein
MREETPGTIRLAPPILRVIASGHSVAALAFSAHTQSNTATPGGGTCVAIRLD